jgi:hypothetical protein
MEIIMAKLFSDALIEAYNSKAPKVRKAKWHMAELTDAIQAVVTAYLPDKADLQREATLKQMHSAYNYMVKQCDSQDQLLASTPFSTFINK